MAFTTDPVRHDLGWLVRWHPEHGRSVVLFRDDEIASVHGAFEGTALLFRAGGYWWDGITWYGPPRSGMRQARSTSGAPSLRR